MSKRTSYLFILAIFLAIVFLVIYSLERVKFPAGTLTVSQLHLPCYAFCSLVTTIILLNRFFGHRLYNKRVVKFKIKY